jgi:hypothetical protein
MPVVQLQLQETATTTRTTTPCPCRVFVEEKEWVLAVEVVALEVSLESLCK